MEYLHDIQKWKAKKTTAKWTTQYYNEQEEEEARAQV